MRNTTPLSPEEAAGLLLPHISTQGQLNQAEQENILSALAWVEQHVPLDILNEGYIRQLHKRMFGSVWRWAGTFRQRDKNLGIAWFQIPVELRKLCDDTRFQIENGVYPPDEIGVRFHHRLVQIHPFPNGNGRHSRLLTDILMENVLKSPLFTWGSGLAEDPVSMRRSYIEALQSADRGDYAELMAFVRR